MSGEPLYTLREVAAMTGFTLHSIEQDCKDGQVRYTRCGGQKRVHRRMNQAQIEELRQFRTSEAKTEPSTLSDVEAVIEATRAAMTKTRRRRS